MLSPAAIVALKVDRTGSDALNLTEVRHFLNQQRINGFWCGSVDLISLRDKSRGYAADVLLVEVRFERQSSPADILPLIQEAEEKFNVPILPLFRKFSNLDDPYTRVRNLLKKKGGDVLTKNDKARIKKTRESYRDPKISVDGIAVDCTNRRVITCDGPKVVIKEDGFSMHRLKGGGEQMVIYQPVAGGIESNKLSAMKPRGKYSLNVGDTVLCIAVPVTKKYGEFRTGKPYLAWISSKQAFNPEDDRTREDPQIKRAFRFLQLKFDAPLPIMIFEQMRLFKDGITNFAVQGKLPYLSLDREPLNDNELKVRVKLCNSAGHSITLDTLQNPEELLRLCLAIRDQGNFHLLRSLIPSLIGLRKIRLIDPANNLEDGLDAATGMRIKAQRSAAELLNNRALTMALAGNGINFYAQRILELGHRGNSVAISQALTDVATVATARELLRLIEHTVDAEGKKVPAMVVRIVRSKAVVSIPSLGAESVVPGALLKVGEDVEVMIKGFSLSLFRPEVEMVWPS